MKVFFSRRIGLDANGQSIPIRFGARLTGRIDDNWNIGALAVQTRSEGEGGETTDFGVARVVRNVGRRSNIGFIATERRGEGGADNRVVGLDTTIKPTDRFGIRGFFSHSSDRLASASLDPATGRSRDGHSAGVSSTYDADAWGLGLETLEVDQDYEPRMGFLLRRDFRFVKPKLSIRPRIGKFGIRNLRMGYAFKHTSQRSTGIMESRAFEGDLIGFETFGGSSFYLWADVLTERLFEPFEIRPWSGHRPRTLRLRSNLQLLLLEPETAPPLGPTEWCQGWLLRRRPAIALDRLAVPTQQVLSTRIESFLDRNRLTNRRLHHRKSRGSAPLSVSRPTSGWTLWYSSTDAAEVLGVNLRFNWIYRPGADLFIVYNKQWQAMSFSSREPIGDQLIVKFTYLFHR